VSSSWMSTHTTTGWWKVKSILQEA
jgi:hypothetical protein